MKTTLMNTQDLCMHNSTYIRRRLCCTRCGAKTMPDAKTGGYICTSCAYSRGPIATGSVCIGYEEVVADVLDKEVHELGGYSLPVLFELTNILLLRETKHSLTKYSPEAKRDMGVELAKEIKTKGTIYGLPISKVIEMESKIATRRYSL